jgi:choline dehydrogenase-like flavoprotein
MDMVYLAGLKYQPRFYLSPTRQRAARCHNAGALFRFNSEVSAEVLHQVRLAARRIQNSRDVRAFFALTRNGLVAGPLVAKMAWRYFIQRRAYNSIHGGCRVLAFVEQAPTRESCMRLSDQKDAFGMFRIELDWRIGAAEIHTLATIAEAVKKACESLGLAEIILDGPVAARDVSFTQRGWDNFHEMGCARMADNPRTGVVDANLKIFGSANGYICSSAVFPTGGFANPTHTAIALALRLSSHLSA